MSKEIIIRSNSTAVDFALLKDGKLIELHKQNDSNKFNVGDIFLAKTKKTISGLNAFRPEIVFLVFAKKISPTLNLLLSFCL